MDPVRVGVRPSPWRTFVGLFVLLSLPAFIALVLTNAITSFVTVAVLLAVLISLMILWLTPHDMNVGLAFMYEEFEGDSGRLDAHLAFGFAPDPVFPELEWDDDEDRS